MVAPSPVAELARPPKGVFAFVANPARPICRRVTRSVTHRRAFVPVQAYVSNLYNTCIVTYWAAAARSTRGLLGQTEQLMWDFWAVPLLVSISGVVSWAVHALSIRPVRRRRGCSRPRAPVVMVTGKHMCLPGRTGALSKSTQDSGLSGLGDGVTATPLYALGSNAASSANARMRRGEPSSLSKLASLPRAWALATHSPGFCSNAASGKAPVARAGTCCRLWLCSVPWSGWHHVCWGGLSRWCCCLWLRSVSTGCRQHGRCVWQHGVPPLAHELRGSAVLPTLVREDAVQWEELRSEAQDLVLLLVLVLVEHVLAVAYWEAAGVAGCPCAATQGMT
eukprot:1399987-Amphidinium_carterae.1